MSQSSHNEENKKDPFAFISLLSEFENPAFTILNDRHTLMIRDGKVHVLVFLKKRNEEAFIECKISKAGLDLINTDKPVMVHAVPEFKESKKLHKGLGLNMFSI